MMRSNAGVCRLGLAILPLLVAACSSGQGPDEPTQSSSQSLLTLPTPAAAWTFNQRDPETGYYNGPGTTTNLFLGEGPFLWAPRYDGIDDQLLMPDQANLHFTTSGTLAAWVRPTATTGSQTLVAKWGNSNSLRAYKLELVSGQYRFSVRSGGVTRTVSAAATADRWAHVVGVYGGGQLRIYINGTQAATLSGTGTITNTSQAITLGYELNGSTSIARFKGKLDEVKLYSQALDAAQVKQLSGINPDASPPLERQTLFVVYDPVVSTGQRLSAYMGFNDPYAVIPDLTTSLQQASGGFADYRIREIAYRNEFPQHMDGTRYDEAGYLACWNNVEACKSEPFDYAKMFADLNICSRLQSGDIHEVAIFGAPWFHFDEFAWKIPNDQMPYNEPTNWWLYQGRIKNIPECGKNVFVMGWSYERDVTDALESYGHRIESALSVTVGRGFWDGCGGHPTLGASDFDRFTCTANHITPSTPVTIAGCGSAHAPPNGVADYDSGNPDFATNTCRSFDAYPFTSPTPVTENCSAHGCEHLGHLENWMSHIPNKPGITSNGNLKNWWKYIVDYDGAIQELGLNNPQQCNEANAVDLGAPGTQVTVPNNGCLKVQNGYPVWWGTRNMQLQNPSGSYPVPFTWSNSCAGSSGSGTFTGDWQTKVIGPTNSQCATLIDLNGSGSGNITMLYHSG